MGFASSHSTSTRSESLTTATRRSRGRSTSAPPTSRVVEPLLKQLDARGIKPSSVAMDGGYDYQAIYQACQTHGALPVVAARKNSGTGDGPIDRASERFKRLYHIRSAVEREIGRLKHHLGGFGVMSLNSPHNSLTLGLDS